MTTLGTYIREARERQRYGLREAAALAEISPSYLSRIETGDEKRPPSEATLRRVAGVLRCDGDDLCRLAGRVPADVAALLLAEPNRFAWVRVAWRRGATLPDPPEADFGNTEETER